MTSEPDAGSKVIASLKRAGGWLFVCVPAWVVVYFLSLFAASSAKISPQPDLEQGRTFHIHAVWQGRTSNPLVADGYVKPWVGHWFHFVQTVGLVLLGLAAVLFVAMMIARKVTDQRWDEPS